MATKIDTNEKIKNLEDKLSEEKERSKRLSEDLKQACEEHNKYKTDTETLLKNCIEMLSEALEKSQNSRESVFETGRTCPECDKTYDELVDFCTCGHCFKKTKNAEKAPENPNSNQPKSFKQKFLDLIAQ
jgi:Fe-S cluster assembly scaffold protein SufB